MSWEKFVGHESLVSRFKSAMQRSKLSGTFLFVGPGGVGKRTFARELAKALFCDSAESSCFEGNACDRCASCQLVDAGNHPDLHSVARLPGKNRLLLEQFIGEDGKRGREGLCYEIALKPFRGRRKVAIIDDADFLNVESANALLKTLEEPPAGALMILISTSEQRQLPTIRSRSQVIRFGRLTADQLTEIISRDQEVREGRDDIGEISQRAAGQLDRVHELTNPEVYEFRQTWLGQLSSLDPASDSFAKSLSQFVDAAGKDAASKRRRLDFLSDLAVDFFRELMSHSVAADSLARDLDSDLQQAITDAHSKLSRSAGAPLRAVKAIDRCLEVKQQISANASQANIIECWLVDLGRIMRGEPVSAAQLLS